VPFPDLLSALSCARGMWLLIGVITILFAVIVRAQLWAALLGNGVRLSDSFWAESIGYLFTNVLPLRMGDPARVFVMSKRSSLPVVHVATSAAIERLLDVLTILAVLVAIFPFMHVPYQVKKAGIVFGLAVLLMLVALIFLVKLNGRGERVLKSICRFVPIIPVERVLKIWQELAEGAAALSSARIAVRVLVLSLLTWALSVGTYWCFLRSFQPDATLTEAAFMLVAVCLAITLPSSPGFIGIFQWVGQQALVLPFNGKYDHATALAVTLTLHLLTYILTSLLGVIGLSRFGLSFVRLREGIVEDPNDHQQEEAFSTEVTYLADLGETSPR